MRAPWRLESCRALLNPSGDHCNVLRLGIPKGDRFGTRQGACLYIVRIPNGLEQLQITKVK